MGICRTYVCPPSEQGSTMTNIKSREFSKNLRKDVRALCEHFDLKYLKVTKSKNKLEVFN